MTRPSTLQLADAAYRRTVPAGDYWIHRLDRGHVLRLVDLEGNQAADTLFFNADDTAERYSAVDTIREYPNQPAHWAGAVLATHPEAAHLDDDSAEALVDDVLAAIDAAR